MLEDEYAQGECTSRPNARACNLPLHMSRCPQVVYPHLKVRIHRLANDVVDICSAHS